MKSATAEKIVTRLKPLPAPQLEAINPEKAKQLLSTMVANRKITDSKVIEFAMSMNNGEWVINGETIKINDKGNLIDGQHRLEACILSGRTFSTWVVRGVDDARAFATIDVGKQRTHSDIFSISGISDSAVASSAAMYLYRWKKGHLRHLPGPSKIDMSEVKNLVRGTKYSKWNGANRVDKIVLLEFAKGYEHAISRSISAMNKIKVSRVMQTTLAVALFVLFEEKDPVDAHNFMRSLASGEELKIGDPVYALRERLLEHRKSAAKLDRWAIMLLTIKAWNSWRNKERVKYMRLLDDEKFPKIT